MKTGTRPGGSSPPTSHLTLCPLNQAQGLIAVGVPDRLDLINGYTPHDIFHQPCKEGRWPHFTEEETESGRDERSKARPYGRGGASLLPPCTPVLKGNCIQKCDPRCLWVGMELGQPWPDQTLLRTLVAQVWAGGKTSAFPESRRC